MEYTDVEKIEYYELKCEICGSIVRLMKLPVVLNGEEKDERTYTCSRNHDVYATKYKCLDLPVKSDLIPIVRELNGAVISDKEVAGFIEEGMIFSEMVYWGNEHVKKRYMLSTAIQDYSNYLRISKCVGFGGYICDIVWFDIEDKWHG